MTFVAGRALTPADLGGTDSAELRPLPSGRLVADHDAALGRHLLDHPQARREAETEPDGKDDDLRRIEMAGVEGGVIGRHSRKLPGPCEFGQSAKLTMPPHVVLMAVELPPDALMPSA